VRAGSIWMAGATLLSIAVCAAPAQAQSTTVGATATAVGGVAPTPPATGTTAPSGTTLPATGTTSPSTGTTTTTSLVGAAPIVVSALGTDTSIVGSLPGAGALVDPAASTGGSAYDDPSDIPRLTVPGNLAKIIHGVAAAPDNAPLAVQQMIWAANEIVGMPYVFGGGHSAFIASGYDCSGTVSFALHGASLLGSPLDSSQLETWGGAGQGMWVTIFANAGHAYMDIAGVRLDTSSADDSSNRQGPRWRPLRKSNAGYRVRHPIGL
jgi:cell wall-associated NlpC family hydrolase